MHVRSFTPAAGAPALAFALALIGLVLVPRSARADCARGAFYDVTATGNTVKVCPCDASTPMLRQDEATGAVVEVSGACGSDSCFADECVPAGTYRYGLAVAYTCAEKGCGTSVPYFGEVTVSMPLASCTPTSTATPTSLVPPWGAGGKGAPVTAELACPGGGCATAGKERGNVLALDLLVAGIGIVVMRLGARHGHRASPRRRP